MNIFGSEVVLLVAFALSSLFVCALLFGALPPVNPVVTCHWFVILDFKWLCRFIRCQDSLSDRKSVNISGIDIKFVFDQLNPSE